MLSLVSTAGSFDRSAIVQRAWALMRDVYHFGRLPFSAIGRRCLGWCLKKAWSEARGEIRRRSIPSDVKAGRIAELREECSALVYIDDWRYVARRKREIEDAIQWLAA